MSESDAEASEASFKTEEDEEESSSSCGAESVDDSDDEAGSEGEGAPKARRSVAARLKRLDSAFCCDNDRTAQWLSAQLDALEARIKAAKTDSLEVREA